MGAAELLLHAHAVGLTLDVADGMLLVSPASRVTKDLLAALRLAKPELLALLATGGLDEHGASWREAFEERAAIMEFDGGLSRKDAEAAALETLSETDPMPFHSRPAVVSCTGCQHHGKRHSCQEPVSAGLLNEAEGFGIIWPPAGFASGCNAFSLRKG
jgi:hypothetical protein